MDKAPNKNKPVYVLGASGHAKVVIATLLAAGFKIGGVLDDDAQKWGQDLMGYVVSGPLAKVLELSKPRAVIAIGVNATRQTVANKFEGVEWVSAVHPEAWVHDSVRLGAGTVVFAKSAIQPDTQIGEHCIVNTAASIDHDCLIGRFAHIAPGCHVAGGVKIGEGAFLGIGSAVIPERAVGAFATIGAGGVVTDDILDGVVAVGVPARTRKAKKQIGFL